MKRPIKFRGRDLIGEMRFGHYVMHDKFGLCQKFCVKAETNRVVTPSMILLTQKNLHCHKYFPYITERGNYWEVEEDSIAQLVGYDKNGKEIFEGDRVKIYPIVQITEQPAHFLATVVFDESAFTLDKKELLTEIPSSHLEIVGHVDD